MCTHAYVFLCFDCRLKYNMINTKLVNTGQVSDGKEVAYNVGDQGPIPGLGISPREGHVNPLQYSCLENANGQRSLVGYSPWGSQSVGHDLATEHHHQHNINQRHYGVQQVSRTYLSWFLPGESQGQRSLVGCRLWGRTESDTTEATQQQQQLKLCTF